MGKLEGMGNTVYRVSISGVQNIVEKSGIVLKERKTKDLHRFEEAEQQIGTQIIRDN